MSILNMGELGTSIAAWIAVEHLPILHLPQESLNCVEMSDGLSVGVI